MNAEVGTPVSAPVQKVFICYRREETAAHAGRLYDAMVARFGESNVFMDVDMAPGVDFVERIAEVVSGCLALIVVMGPSWATVADEDGTRRIDDPEDFVRLEVESAVRRSDVTLIPVLVSGARMPRREDLPSELQPITRRNALELSEGRWGYDVGRLMSVLDELLPDGAVAGITAAISAPPTPPLSKRLVLEGMLVAGITAAAARLLGDPIPMPDEIPKLKHGEPDELSPRETAEQIGGTILQETVVLALIGAALAIWLALRIRRVDPVRPGVRGLLVGALAGAISGTIWALPVFLPDEKVGFQSRADIALGAIAVAGGLIGALIGSLWHRRRTAAGFVCGAVGGFLFQLIAVIVLEWKPDPLFETLLAFGLAAAAMAGLTLAAMLALDGRRSSPRPPPT